MSDVILRGEEVRRACSEIASHPLLPEKAGVHPSESLPRLPALKTEDIYAVIYSVPGCEHGFVEFVVEEANLTLKQA